MVISLSEAAFRRHQVSHSCAGDGYTPRNDTYASNAPTAVPNATKNYALSQMIIHCLLLYAEDLCSIDS